jgi:hypothetical protein
VQCTIPLFLYCPPLLSEPSVAWAPSSSFCMLWRNIHIWLSQTMWLMMSNFYFVNLTANNHLHLKWSLCMPLDVTPCVWIWSWVVQMNLSTSGVHERAVAWLRLIVRLAHCQKFEVCHWQSFSKRAAIQILKCKLWTFQHTILLSRIVEFLQKGK